MTAGSTSRICLSYGGIGGFREKPLGKRGNNQKIYLLFDIGP